jgi:hypothetical protein
MVLASHTFRQIQNRRNASLRAIATSAIRRAEMHRKMQKPTFL